MHTLFGRQVEHLGIASEQILTPRKHSQPAIHSITDIHSERRYVAQPDPFVGYRNVIEHSVSCI